MFETRYMSRKLALIAALLFAFAGACVAEEDPSEDGVGDVGNDNDGDNTEDNDDDPGVELGCATADSYSAATDAEAEQLVDDEGDTYIELYAELDADPLNELEVSLWNGAGAFEEAPIGPGTYSIEGPEASYADCGVCVVIYGDIDPATDQERQMLMAQSGTVQIDSVAGTMSGSLENVVLVEVNPATNLPVDGGCQTTIPALDFEAPMP